MTVSSGANQMSARCVTSASIPRHCSGAMYSGVPSIALQDVMNRRAVCSGAPSADLRTARKGSVFATIAVETRGKGSVFSPATLGQPEVDDLRPHISLSALAVWK